MEKKFRALVINYKPFFWVFRQGADSVVEDEISDSHWKEFLMTYAGTFMNPSDLTVIDSLEYSVIKTIINTELSDYTPSAKDLCYVMKKGGYSNAEYFLDDFFDTDSFVAGHSLVRFVLARLMEDKLAEEAEKESFARGE